MAVLASRLSVLFFAIASCKAFLFNVKTDCLISGWSPWTVMPGIDMQLRERAVLRHDKLGGIPCPANDELRQVMTVSSPSLEDTHAHIQATARSISQNFIRRQPRRSDPNEPAHVRDLLIIIDSSGSISSSAFDKTKRNLVELIGMLCPQPDPFSPLYNHAALIDFSNDVIEMFDFNKYQSVYELKRAIMNVPHISSSTCTAKALNYASNMLTTWKGMRSDNLVDKEVLILTDGESNCGGDAIASALNLQTQATVFSLQIGRNSFSGMRELINYVTTPAPNHLFAMKTYRGFDQLMALLRQQQNSGQCVPFDLP